jgi:AcrR family transcriptional regulator
MASTPDLVNARLHIATPARDDPASARPRDAARTRARILEAAQQIFSTHGYTHAGMREIAVQADVNVALVARYFGSKEKLFEAALDALLSASDLWSNPRDSFGRSIVSQFIDQKDAALNPLPMLMQAAADPVSQSVALSLIRTRVLAPLAEWLGPPSDEARAAEILALCAGFFTYRIMLPLPSFSGGLDAEIRLWLEDALQAIVDGRSATTV